MNKAKVVEVILNYTVLCDLSHKISHERICLYIVIVDSLTKLLPRLFMSVLLPYYALFYSFNCHTHKLFLLVI